jgi:hypothetical protein
VRLAVAATLAALALFPAGCKSYRIDVRVENRTGQALNLVEVDYPSASFGMDTLADGTVYPYHLQVRGSGPVKVQYTETKTNQVRQMTGPELAEHEEGTLTIVLLPEGKADFQPRLSGK